MATYYDTLQVSPSADPAVIDSAYRSLVARFQPLADTNPEAARELREIHEAYQVLGDPARRAQYDQALRGMAASSASAPPRPAATVPPPTTGATGGPPRRGGFPIWLIAILGACALLTILVCVAVLALSPIRSLVGLAQPTRVIIIPGATPEVATPETRPTSNVGYITRVVMATSTEGDNFDPVGITTTFPPDATFHAVVTIQDAPANSAVRAVWYAQDVGSAAAPNTKIDEYTITTDGSRNLDFTLRPKTTWAAGTYRVEIFGNGKVAKKVTFNVQAGASENQSQGSTSGLVESTTFCRDVSANVFEPVDPTTTFTPNDQVLHFVVAIKDAPANTEFKASWYFGEQLIDSTTLTADGTRNLDFRLRQNKPWPTGEYHVDLFVNGNLDQTADFTVQ